MNACVFTFGEIKSRKSIRAWQHIKWARSLGVANINYRARGGNVTITNAFHTSSMLTTESGLSKT